jgi:hypothetical protein
MLTKGGTIKLSKKQKQKLIDLYSSSKSRADIQKQLAKEFKVTTRTIRNIARGLGLNVLYSNTKNDKIMVYDIETSYVLFEGWSTGKTYNSWKDIHGEKCTKIISVSWKWIGEDKVYALTWDENQCDKQLMIQFLKEYNKAVMVVGFNNNSFDNKIINSRAWIHSLFIKTHITSFDVYRHVDKTQRHQSKSLAYLCEVKGLTSQKLTHRGKIMWREIQFGSKEVQKNALKEMVNYNKGDIVSTEELYVTLRPYFKHAIHFGVKDGLPKWVCPNTGSTNIKLLDTKYTPAGTVQRILYCEESGTQYKVNNKTYMDFLQRAMDLSWQNDV